MSDFDHVMMWVFLLATIAVIVGSGKADAMITSISTVMTKAVGTVVGPAK